MATVAVEELRKNMGGTTTMYSIETRPHRDKSGRKTGEMETVIVEHQFPWDRNSKYSAPKFQRMLARGFTFEKPTIEGTLPGEVITEVKTEAAPELYVSARDLGERLEKPKSTKKRALKN